MKKQGEYYTCAHACFLLQYHMVLVTKYRAKALTGKLARDLEQDIRDLFKKQECVITEISVQPDHVHILFEAPSLRLTFFSRKRC